MLRHPISPACPEPGQLVEHGLAETGMSLADGRDYPLEKDADVLIVGIKIEPGVIHVQSAQRLGDERRLAVSRASDDHGQALGPQRRQGL